MKFEQLVFNIDGIDGYYKGYFAKQRWNGWAVPYFTKKVADQIADHLVETGSGVWYCEANDTYYINLEGYTIEDAENVEWFEGMDIEVGGQSVHVYSIGGYSWIWDEYYPVKCCQCNNEFYAYNRDTDICYPCQDE